MSLSEAALGLVFPGVGVRPGPAERAFFEQHRETMEPAITAASEAAGLDLSALLLEGGEPDELGGQLLGYAFACGASRVLAQQGWHPSVTAGYSMGLYAALVAAGALSFEDGLRCVSEARRLVARACEGESFGLAMVLGLEDPAVQALLSEAGPSLCLVNCNNPHNLVVAGRGPELDTLVQLAIARGALRAERLAVDLPYHHPGLLSETGRVFSAFLRGLVVQRPRCPVATGLSGALTTDPERLREWTAQNLCSPVRLASMLEAVASVSVALVVECGLGVTLTQNARFLPGSPRLLPLKLAARRLRGETP